jgi:hypothetical protein
LLMVALKNTSSNSLLARLLTGTVVGHPSGAAQMVGLPSQMPA